ncbi:HAMP domain-containing protein [Xanthomonas axonopodis]|uniref:HAMP domain-containing protein n=1 Tax=Xanthomonas axonopodis TaxID=53413 RepID=UPI003558C37B
MTRQNDSTQKAYGEALTAIAGGRAMLIAGGVIVLVVRALLGWIITRSLTTPLSRATKVANAIAHGDLSSDAQTKSQDEPGRLLQAMHVMQTQIRSLMSAQSDMAKRHDEGQTSFRMDAQAFPGDYGRMAEDTNALVASHCRLPLIQCQPKLEVCG